MTSAALRAIAKPVVPKFDSKWEEKYHAHLVAQRNAGKIVEFWWKGFRLRVGEGAWYTPEAIVLANDGYLELHEVKGYKREAAMVRYRAAKERYPFRAYLVRLKKGGEWVMEGDDGL